MSYLTTQRAHILSSVIQKYAEWLSLHALACFYVWSIFRGRRIRKGVAAVPSNLFSIHHYHYIVTQAANENHRSETGACRATNAIFTSFCILTFIPCPYTNYVALPKRIIIISNGAKMTQLYLLLEAQHIFPSGPGMRHVTHLYRVLIIF